MPVTARKKTMKTYDTAASTHGTRPFWQSLRALLRRWIDREREIVSLRNAVGMMSEARRADAAEYHDMAAANRKAFAENRKIREALGAMLTHMGMDEDEWNKPTFDQARRALDQGTA